MVSIDKFVERFATLSIESHNFRDAHFARGGKMQYLAGGAFVTMVLSALYIVDKERHEGKESPKLANHLLWGSMALTIASLIAMPK